MNAPFPDWTYSDTDPVDLALQELRDTDEAVSLAKIASVARREVAWFKGSQPAEPYRGARNACIDAYALCREALADLIHSAASSYDLDASNLPSTDEIINMLAKEADAPARRLETAA